MPSAPFSTESYFQTQKPPVGLDERVGRVKSFVDKWKEVEGKRVVLVTVSCLVLRPSLKADLVEWGNNRSTGSQHVCPILTSRTVADETEYDSSTTSQLVQEERLPPNTSYPKVTQ